MEHTLLYMDRPITGNTTLTRLTEISSVSAHQAHHGEQDEQVIGNIYIGKQHDALMARVQLNRYSYSLV